MVVLSLTKAWLWSNALLSLASALTLPSPNNQTQTKKFELTVTWEKGAPDGFERELFKINGQFPGPKLEINEGDAVEILVKNRSPFNTSLHYHGQYKHCPLVGCLSSHFHVADGNNPQASRC